MGDTTRIDRTVSVLLALAALVIAGSVAYRTFQHEGVRAESEVASAPEPVDDSLWTAMLSLGSLLAGSQNAPAAVVEFSDLECPACRGFQGTLEAFARDREGDVRVLYIPFPLPYHRFATAPANAAECADSLGMLAQWVNTIYAYQDSLGLKPWASLAASAGIRDSIGIQACATRRETAPRVRSALALGARIGPIGTPTVIVNGMRFLATPTRGQLDSAVDAALRSIPPSPDRLLIMGLVVDSNSGQPVPDAEVALVDASGNVVVSGKSDVAGAFTLEAQNGEYSLRVSGTGYSTFVGNLKRLDGALPPHLIILGRTRDAGPPRTGAQPT